MPHSGEQGRADPKQSFWFSLVVTPEDFPWIFVRGKKPSQIISTLEALAVLLSLRLFARRQPEGQRSRVTILPTWTDNRGNGSVQQVTCCRDEEKQRQSPGRMDTERVQPGSRRFGQLRFKPVQSRTTVANRAARLEVARLGQSIRNGSIAERAHYRLRQRGGLPDRAQKQKRRRREDRLKFKDPWLKYLRTRGLWMRHEKGALAEIGCLSLHRIVLLVSFSLCPLFTAPSSARLCSSPVLSVMVCNYFNIYFLSCFSNTNHFSVFHASGISSFFPGVQNSPLL